MQLLRVTAPYVTLRVRDDLGAWSVRGFYAGACVPTDKVDPDSLRHHVEGGMAVIDDPAPAAAPEEDKGTQKPGGKPGGNASRDDWAAYATGKGAPEEDTKPIDQGGLSRDDLRAKYGNGS